MGLFDWLGLILLVVGTVCCLIGISGVMRLNDFYNRLHAAGMVITGGAGGVLLAVALLGDARVAYKAVATTAFLLLTAPLVTHVLCRTAHRKSVPLWPEKSRDDLAEDTCQRGGRHTGTDE